LRHSRGARAAGGNFEEASKTLGITKATPSGKLNEQYSAHSTAHVVIGGDVSLVNLRHCDLDGAIDRLLALAKISIYTHRAFFVAGIGDHRRGRKATICIRGHEWPDEESAISDVRRHLELHTYFATSRQWRSLSIVIHLMRAVAVPCRRHAQRAALAGSQ